MKKLIILLSFLIMPSILFASRSDDILQTLPGAKAQALLTQQRAAKANKVSPYKIIKIKTKTTVITKTTTKTTLLKYRNKSKKQLSKNSHHFKTKKSAKHRV